jgi:hypothetical protein
MGGTIRLNKGRFLCTFLVSFALLLVAWQRVDGARWYTRGLLAGAALVGPALHGWVLETEQDGFAHPTWVHGNRHVRASVQFDALAVGLVPVLALLLATPGLRLRRRALLLAGGALLYFAVDTLIVALFPLLVFYKNPFTDVLGTFLGLITFVGAPVIIWFALTFPQLRQSLRPLK